MKYVLLKSAGKVAVEETSLPVLNKGDILVEMKVCGLCGTDIEKIHGRYLASQPVLGHEASGVVADVGESVEGFKERDRVFPHHHVPCYECHLCRHGSETMCPHYRDNNLYPGGFAEYFLVPAWNVEHGGVLKLPDRLTFEEASLIEPTACCIRSLNRCNIQGDEIALVIGAGPIGLTHLRLLSVRGVKVLMSDFKKTRLKLAERLGALAAYDEAKTDVALKVKEQTWGMGADLVVVAAGSPTAIVQALRAVRKGGKICLFGVPAKDTRLNYDFSDIFNSEISIITSNAATEAETKAALWLMEKGKLNLTSIITHTFKLDCFETAVKKALQGDCGKITITP